MSRKIAVLAAFFVAIGLVSQAAADPLKLKFSSFEPPKAFGPAKVYAPWIKAVNKASDGTLDIQLYAGGALGKPTAQLQVVENGVADLAVIVPSFTPNRFKYNEIGELPFLWEDATVAGVAIWRLIKKGLLKYPGFKVVSAQMTAPYQLHADRPIAKIADLKGLKIRAAGPIFGQIVRALGAVPVGIPTPAVAENIDRGVLDGTMNDWTLVKAFRILDVTNHHIQFPLGGVIALLGMNQKSYDSLPPKAKAAIDKYGGPYYAKLWGDVVKAETKEIIAEVKADPKQTIVYPDAAQRKRWKARLQPVIDKWAAAPEHKKRLKAFKAELDAARKEYGK